MKTKSFIALILLISLSLSLISCDLSFLDKKPSEDNTNGEAVSTQAPKDEDDEKPNNTKSIAFIGMLMSINEKGPNGADMSASNNYSVLGPSTHEKAVKYNPPLAKGEFKYYCRSLSISGWAIVEGGQGDIVWSDDHGITWQKVDDQQLSTPPTGTDLKSYAGMVNINKLKTDNAWINQATVDLSDYDDGECLDIWFGRETKNNKTVALFKISGIYVGDEKSPAEPPVEKPTTEQPTTEKPTEAPTEDIPMDEPPTDELPTAAPPVDVPPEEVPTTAGIPTPNTEISIAEANSLGRHMGENKHTTDKYYVRGKIFDIYNPSNGSMIITDNNGNFLAIYMSSNADGTVYFKDMTLQPQVGDDIFIYGIIGQYAGSPQMKNGWIITVNGLDTTEDLPGDDDNNDPFDEWPTTDSSAEDTTTDVPYIGMIQAINGLGPNGKKWSASNGYHTNPPSTNNPVQFMPPVVDNAWDYTCRSFKVEGWAMLQDGQGALVWSDDFGATWKEITNITIWDGINGASTNTLSTFADVAGITRFNEWDLSFSATIDLSGYEDGEYVTIWIGRKTADGSAVQAIFKFYEVMIGDELPAN